MSVQQLARRGLAAAFMLTLASVASSRVDAQCLNTENRIEMNRQQVPRGDANNLREFLSRVVNARRLGAFAIRPVDQPIVVIDGVLLTDGLAWLDMIPLTDVQRVTTLRPLDSMLKYGGMAQGGAIVVETVQGRVSRGEARLPECSMKRDP